MTLTKKQIGDLIDTGKQFPDEINLVRQKFNDDSLNRLHWKEWNRFCKELVDEDLIFLFKGIVQVENKLGWMGGSVAGGVWVYRNIQSRNHYQLSVRCHILQNLYFPSPYSIVANKFMSAPK